MKITNTESNQKIKHTDHSRKHAILFLHDTLFLFFNHIYTPTEISQ